MSYTAEDIEKMLSKNSMQDIDAYKAHLSDPEKNPAFKKSYTASDVQQMISNNSSDSTATSNSSAALSPLESSVNDAVTRNLSKQYIGNNRFKTNAKSNITKANAGIPVLEARTASNYLSGTANDTASLPAAAVAQKTDTKPVEEEDINELMEKALQSDYQMTSAERKQLKNYADDWLDDYGKKIKEGSITADQFKADEFDENSDYNKMIRLSNKSSLGSAFVSGVMDSVSKLPGISTLTDKISGLSSEDVYTPGDAINQTISDAKVQSPVAEGAGNMVGEMAKYSTAKGIMQDIPVVQSAQKALSGAVAGALPFSEGVASKLGESTANVLSDLALDEVFDVIPYLKETKSEDDTAGDVAKKVAGRTAMNLGMNVLGEAVPYAAGAAWKGVKKLFGSSSDLSPLEDAAKALKNQGDSLEPIEIPDLDEYLKSSQLEDVPDIEIPDLEEYLKANSPEDAPIEIPNLEDYLKSSQLDDSVKEGIETASTKVASSGKQLSKDSKFAQMDKELAKLVDWYGDETTKEEFENLRSWLAEYEETGSPEAFSKIEEVKDRMEASLQGKTKTYPDKLKKNGTLSRKGVTYTYGGNISMDDIMDGYADVFSDVYTSKLSPVGKTASAAAEATESASSLTKKLNSIGLDILDDDGAQSLVADAKMNLQMYANGQGSEEAVRRSIEKLNNYLSSTGKQSIDIDNELQALKRNIGDYFGDYTRYSDTHNPDGLELERGYSESVGKGKVKDLDSSVADAFKSDPAMYKQLSNKVTLQNAEDIYKAGNAEAEFWTLLEKQDPVSVVLGNKIANDMIADGRKDEAVTVINAIAEQMTKAGQFTQAAVIGMTQGDPETALKYLQREITKMNENGLESFGKKWKDFNLTDSEIDMFKNIEKGDSDAITKAFESIGDRISKEYPSKFSEKLTEFRHMVMLLNPRTHIRNTVANAVTGVTTTVSGEVSALGQNAYHLINPDFKPTQSFTGAFDKQYRALASDIWDQVKDGITEGSKYIEQDGAQKQVSGLVSDAIQDKQVFKGTKLGKAASDTAGKLTEFVTGGRVKADTFTGSALEDLRQFDYWLLGAVEDDPFVKQNFIGRLASYMKAQGIKDISEVPDEAIETATQEALKATFKDDNAITSFMSSAKKFLNKAGGLGEIALPFTKTPANLAARSIDYSPVGLANTFNDAIKSNKKVVKAVKMAEELEQAAQNTALSGKALSSAQAAAKAARQSADALSQKAIGDTIDNLAKNLTGTALIGAGIALASKGMITGAYSEDTDEKAYQKQQGYLEYAFHIGDHYYTYDWAQPTSTGLIIGTEIYNAIMDSDDENRSIISKLGTGALNASEASVDAWFNQSPLQSLAEMVGNGDYSSDSVGENIANSVMDVPGSFIPAISGATARTVDPTIRETYDPNSTIGTLKNEAIAKIPFLSKSLPASYDTWGNERTRSDSKGQAAFAQYINPGQLGNNNSIDIDSEIQSLYDSTQNSEVYPTKAKRSVTVSGEDGDSKLSLSNKQYSELQKTQGQASQDLARSFINSDSYSSLTDDEKAYVLNKSYGLAKSYAESETVGGKITETQAKYVDQYKSGKTEDILSRYEFEAVAESVGSGTGDKEYEVYKNSGREGLERYAQTKNSIKSSNEDGKTSTSYSVQYLAKSDMTDKEKGQYLIDSGTVSLKNDSGSNTTLGDIYDRSGASGVWKYEKTMQNVKSSNSENSDAMKYKIPYLESDSSLSDAEKGQFLIDSGLSLTSKSGSSKAGKVYSSYGAEGVYQYKLAEYYADQYYPDNGESNGTASKKEWNRYINSLTPVQAAYIQQIYNISTAK